MKFKILSAALLVVTSIAAAGEEHYCDARNGHDDELLRKLYYYALLAESAKNGELSPWRCEADDEETRAPMLYRSDASDDTTWSSVDPQRLLVCGEPPCISEVTTNDVRDNDDQWENIKEYFLLQGRYVGVYEPSSDGPASSRRPAYFVCDDSISDVFIFISLAKLQAPDDDGDLRRWIVRPLVWLVDNALIDEAVQTVTLQLNSELSADGEFPETVTAIRGTDPSLLSQWSGSSRDLSPLTKSCVFDLMARVLGEVVAIEAHKYAITGHSLGGAVAQYIAQYLSSGGVTPEIRFFSFNAVGIDVEAAGSPSKKILHSFYIDGDPASAIGSLFGRSQGGRTIKYIPPESANDEEFWNSAGPLDRHALTTVQHAICECMNRRGELNVWSRLLR